MLTFRTLLFGVLLCAAPLLSLGAPGPDPVREGDAISWFTLEETRAEVVRALGRPVLVSSFGDDYETWQYRLGETEEEGYSHHLVFRKSTGRLISVTRNYFPERVVDEWFAEPASTTYRSGTGSTTFPVRVLKLRPERLLVAMGVSAPGQRTGQIFLIRESELPRFLPWLAAKLE